MRERSLEDKGNKRGERRGSKSWRETGIRVREEPVEF